MSFLFFLFFGTSMKIPNPNCVVHVIAVSNNQNPYPDGEILLTTKGQTCMQAAMNDPKSLIKLYMVWSKVDQHLLSLSLISSFLCNQTITRGACNASIEITNIYAHQL